MNTGEVVVHEVQGSCGLIVLNLLLKRIGQSGEAANLHPMNGMPTAVRQLKRPEGRAPLRGRYAGSLSGGSTPPALIFVTHLVEEILPVFSDGSIWIEIEGAQAVE